MLIGYARVSTHDQNANLQRDALEAAGCARVFVETSSGIARRRPELRAALRHAARGDVIVVWKLDRLARSMLQLIELVRSLDERGVGFVSLTENIDTTTPAGRLVLHIFGALAEFERSIIIERTKAGLEAARQRGRVGGRPRKLSDADQTRARELLEHTTARPADIARELGVSISTLYAYVPGGRRGARSDAEV